VLGWLQAVTECRLLCCSILTKENYIMALSETETINYEVCHRITRTS